MPQRLRARIEMWPVAVRVVIAPTDPKGRLHPCPVPAVTRRRRRKGCTQRRAINLAMIVTRRIERRGPIAPPASHAMPTNAIISRTQSNAMGAIPSRRSRSIAFGLRSRPRCPSSNFDAESSSCYAHQEVAIRIILALAVVSCSSEGIPPHRDVRPHVSVRESPPDEAPSSAVPASSSADSRKSAYKDCDPRDTTNSDGSPKRASAPGVSQPPETLVLAYDDFGPQASSSRLIGLDWWSWEGGGSWEMCDSFDVRVVVYRHITEKEAKLRYPSAHSKADLIERGWADYRFVEYGAALQHIDEELSVVRGVPELASMSDELRAMRLRITEGLADARPSP